MIPYYILIFFPIMIQYIKIEGIDYKQRNKISIFVFFAILAAMLSLKHPSIGNDTYNYFNIVEQYLIYDLSIIKSFTNEIGFAVLIKGLSYISANPQVIIGIISVLTVLFIFATYIQYTVDASLTIAIFCILSTFPMLFSGVRQMIAVGIGFICFYFVKKNNIIMYIIVALVGVSIHTSAVMLFFMYPLYYLRITQRRVLVLVPVMTLVFWFNDTIFTYLGRYIETYTRFDASITNTGGYLMIVLLAVFSVYSFIIPDESLMDKDTKAFRNFVLFSVLIQMFAPIHTLAMRMGYYYLVFIPLLIPKIIEYRKIKWINIAVYSKYIMLLVFVVYFYYVTAVIQPLHTAPYVFYWEKI